MVHQRKSSIALFLITLIAVTACDTTSNIQEPVYKEQRFSVRVVQVPYKTHYGPAVVDDIMEGSIERAPAPGTYDSNNVPKPSAFGCMASWVNQSSKPEFKYRYYTRFLYFPKFFIEEAKNRYKYVVTKALSPQAPDGKSMGMTHCIVPYVEGIDKMLAQFLEIYGKKNSPNIKFTVETTRSRELDPNYYEKNREYYESNR